MNDEKKENTIQVKDLRLVRPMVFVEGPFVL